MGLLIFKTIWFCLNKWHLLNKGIFAKAKPLKLPKSSPTKLGQVLILKCPGLPDLCIKTVLNFVTEGTRVSLSTW